MTGCDISLYSLGTVGSQVVGLDLSISFMLVLFQAVLRNAPFPKEPQEHLEFNSNGTMSLKKTFLDDEEEEPNQNSV